MYMHIHVYIPTIQKSHPYHLQELLLSSAKLSASPNSHGHVLSVPHRIAAPSQDTVTAQKVNVIMSLTSQNHVQVPYLHVHVCTHIYTYTCTCTRTIVYTQHERLVYCVYCLLANRSVSNY